MRNFYDEKQSNVKMVEMFFNWTVTIKSNCMRFVSQQGFKKCLIIFYDFGKFVGSTVLKINAVAPRISGQGGF